MQIRRVVAALAAVILVAGAWSFRRAVVLTQGWWYDGFVSETGQPGAPHRDGYVYGILGLSAALVLLAVALLRPPRMAGSAWVTWSAAGLLAGGGGLAALSSLVACSAGCPLPPYETPTGADLVHAASSMLGLGAVGAAMVVLALGPAPSSSGSVSSGMTALLQRISRGWLVAVVPLFLAAGLSLLLQGRGYTTGSVEKVLVVVVMGWVLAASLVIFAKTG